MDMAKKRINLTLDEGACALLEEVGNGSDYIEKLIGRHHSEWTGALFHIRSLGWRDQEILGVVDLSNGYHPPGAQLAPGMARVMAEDAEGRGVLARRGIDCDRWHTHAAEVRARPELAQALWILGQEYWFGNMALRQELGRK